MQCVLALGVIPGICVIGVVCAVLFPPPQDYLCERIQEEMKRDMAVWNYRNNLMLLSSRFLGMEQGSDGITVKYYCETNMGPAVYKAFCNGYGGYKRAGVRFTENSRRRRLLPSLPDSSDGGGSDFNVPFKDKVRRPGEGDVGEVVSRACEADFSVSPPATSTLMGEGASVSTA